MRFFLIAFLPMLTGLALAVEETPAAPDGRPLPGHSTHGEAFNEGPRRQAVLIGSDKVGNIRFPVTTKSAAAQAFFNQGVGQLHGFWYFEAERSFRQVALLDPDCAMAFWGLAMANINNPERAKEFIRNAGKLKAKASPLEQAWIHALAVFCEEKNDGKRDDKQRRIALVKALEKISFDFPENIEVKAFLVFHLWDNSMHEVPLASHQAVDALAQQVLAAQPMHPIHHYLIHLWNNEDDRRALADAARCGQSAPAIAHMWHMSGHTFTRLKRYADAAWQQEASARVDHEHTMRQRILPEEIHNYAHNNDWLVEDLAFIGRVRDAADLARNMVELPRLAPQHTIVGKDNYDDEKSGHILGERRLLQILPRFELWDELCALDGTMFLAPLEDPVEEMKRQRTLGIAWFVKGDKARGEEKLNALQARVTKAKKSRYADADEAERKANREQKPADKTAKAMADAMQKYSREIEEAEKLIAELRLYRALGTGDIAGAKAELEKAGDLPKERLVAIHRQLGDFAKAEETARQFAKNNEGQVLPLALLADVLWQAGKKQDALDTFQKLRDLSAQADPDLPAFQRLAPLVAELKLAADWRPELKWPADSGTRPPLASLGPFRWEPYTAPAWQLADREGRALSLHAFKRKPVLVVFYLGHGCTHCIEQLNVFAPETKAFADAGIAIVAISSDDADALPKTFAQLKDGEAAPFPIVADPHLEVFKAYHCYDEFENMPLHGTFLIDGSGLVRWQDIGFEPFRDAKWLLGEAKRLLTLANTPHPG